MSKAILVEIERFLRESGMPPSTFGRKAVNDPRFVWDLRYGDREARESTKERCRQFMSHWRKYEAH